VRLWLFSLSDAKSDANGKIPRRDLRGGPITVEYRIDWKNFFDTGLPPTAGENRDSKKIQPKLSGPLLPLPRDIIPDTQANLQEPAESHLAIRTLDRGRRMQLPSGQEVACRMDIEPLEGKDLWGDLPFKKQHAPLWYYILKEAEVKEKGERLGPVGGRIVAEVILGLLLDDNESYIKKMPDWKPVLPSREKEKFTIVDLLKVAKVDQWQASA
jgi:hypothetical protein